MAQQDPNRHPDRHQVFGTGHEADWYVAVAADDGDFSPLRTGRIAGQVNARFTRLAIVTRNLV